jgi:hypothetical protein
LLIGGELGSAAAFSCGQDYDLAACEGSNEKLKTSDPSGSSKGARIRVRASQQKFSSSLLPCSDQKAAKLYMLSGSRQGLRA